VEISKKTQQVSVKTLSVVLLMASGALLGENVISESDAMLYAGIIVNLGGIAAAYMASKGDA